MMTVGLIVMGHGNRDRRCVLVCVLVCLCVCAGVPVSLCVLIVRC